MTNDLFEFADQVSLPMLVPKGQYVKTTLSGMSGSDSIIVQVSTDNAATWADLSTKTSDADYFDQPDPTQDVYVRLYASVVEAGHAILASATNVMDAAGVTPLGWLTFDYIYDFAVHGGTNNSNFLLTPSKPVPANTMCVGVFVETLTTFTGGGGFNLGVGLTGNLDCLKNNVVVDGTRDTAGDLGLDMFPEGTREIFIDHDGGGAVDVRGRITGNNITAGKARITLLCLSYGV